MPGRRNLGILRPGQKAEKNHGIKIYRPWLLSKRTLPQHVQPPLADSYTKLGIQDQLDAVGFNLTANPPTRPIAANGWRHWQGTTRISRPLCAGNAHSNLICRWSADLYIRPFTGHRPFTSVSAFAIHMITAELRDLLQCWTKVDARGNPQLNQRRE